MKRIRTLVAVMMFGLIGAPLAALGEGADNGKADANSNAQSAEDAKKGLERSAERHEAKAKARGREEAAHAKTKAEHAEHHASSHADKAKHDAAEHTHKAKGDAKAQVDATMPGADVETGGATK